MKKTFSCLLILVLNDSLSYSQNFWQQTNCLYEVPIVSLVINSTGKIFAACDGKGIYISTDNGIYWTQINNGLTTNYIRLLAINSAGYIFAGTNDAGVLKHYFHFTFTKIILICLIRKQP